MQADTHSVVFFAAICFNSRDNASRLGYKPMPSERGRLCSEMRMLSKSWEDASSLSPVLIRHTFAARRLYSEKASQRRKDGEKVKDAEAKEGEAWWRSQPRLSFCPDAGKITRSRTF